MSSDLPTYALGATLISVGLSATVRVVPPAGCNGGFFKIAVSSVGNSGLLAIVQGISSIASQGYVLGDGEAISMSGPAIFYLAASGATTTVALCQTYSQGVLTT